MLRFPIASRVKGYPFEVALPDGAALVGVVLADQDKSLDWRARAVEIVGTVPRIVTLEVIDKLGVLLE